MAERKDIDNGIFDAKGDLLAGTGSDAFAVLGVGANGKVLTADSTKATGLDWVAVPAAQVDQSDGQAGVMVPTIPGWGGINNVFTAKRACFLRFTLLKDRTITSIKFRSNAAGTGNVDVCICDASGTILKSSGSTAGKKGATTWQSVALSSSLALTANTIYYVGLMTDVGDGSFTAVNWNPSTGQALDQMWGSTLGLLQSFIKDLPTFPFGSQTITVGTATAAVGPIAGLV